jgi:hypothetical protein
MSACRFCSCRGTMKYFRIVVLAVIFSLSSFVKPVLAQERLAVIGNAIGEISSVDGPAMLQVDMGNCQFSMVIGEGEHVKYNDPELILYRAKRLLPDRDLPYLKQAEMTAGYDWWFEEPKAIKFQWVGLMCENVSDFNWASGSTQTDISRALQGIIEANSLKCPADFNGKQWNSKNSDNNFERIEVVGGSGFLINRKSKNGVQGSRFCFVHGKNVLIGVSGGGVDLRSRGSPLSTVIRSIKFKSDTLPVTQ